MGGDLIAACARAGQLDGIRVQAARERLQAFVSALLTVREEMRTGRSLGHLVVKTVMLRGGLVEHFERQRDSSPSTSTRRDAKRVLEDLRSLCRSAQAFEEHHGAPASVGEFLEYAIGLHAQELASGEDRRVTVSTIHSAKGTEAELVVVLGLEEQVLPCWQALQDPDREALCERAPPLLRRVHPRQGHAGPHLRAGPRRARHRRPLPVSSQKRG